MTEFDWENKIASLLRKAEDSGVTAEEAEAFREAAERLAAKFSVDRARVEALRMSQGGAPETITTGNLIYLDGVYSAGFQSIGVSVAYALGLHPFVMNGLKSDRTIRVVGFESDLKLFDTLFTSLRLQAATAQSAFWRQHPDRGRLTNMKAFKEKRQFLFSFGTGVAARLTLARTVVASESTGTDIVLMDRKTRVNQWIEEQQFGARKNDGSVKQARSAGDGGSHFARIEGNHAGRTADTGDRRVGRTNTRKELS